MKLALLVMGMPWLLVTDSGPDYSSQQFSTFLSSWRISHCFEILYNLKGQEVVERVNHSLKEVFALVTSLEYTPSIDRGPTSCEVFSQLI